MIISQGFVVDLARKERRQPAFQLEFSQFYTRARRGV
jgi:hypothetical protein